MYSSIRTILYVLCLVIIVLGIIGMVKQEKYKNGDDIIIATKSNILSVRKLYKYPKGIILQAMNASYPSLNVNIMSPDMILGKVIAVHREIK